MRGGAQAAREEGAWRHEIKRVLRRTGAVLEVRIRLFGSGGETVERDARSVTFHYVELFCNKWIFC
jgi:hypothetical protein